MTRLRRAPGLSIAGLLSLAILAVPGAGPAVGGSPAACQVRDLVSGATSETHADVVAAAAGGDRLTVRGTQ